jgi:hypothetical protein
MHELRRAARISASDSPLRREVFRPTTRFLPCGRKFFFGCGLAGDGACAALDQIRSRQHSPRCASRRSIAMLQKSLCRRGFLGFVTRRAHRGNRARLVRRCARERATGAAPFGATNVGTHPIASNRFAVCVIVL